MFSITKNCETLIKQTHKIVEETLEIKLTRPRETFSYKPSINFGLDSICMIGFTSLEVYNSFFNLTEENNKFKLYTDASHEISFVKLKDKVTDAVGFSDLSPEDLQHKLYGLRIIKTYGKLSIEKSQTDGYCILLMRYAQSPFRDSESYHTILNGLREDDIRIILKQYDSNFITYEVFPGNHTIKDLYEFLSRGFRSNFKTKEKMR